MWQERKDAAAVLA
jgi:hypothetical protein